MNKFLLCLLATTVSLSAFDRIEEFGKKSDSDSPRSNSMIVDNEEHQLTLEDEQQIDLKNLEQLTLGNKVGLENEEQLDSALKKLDSENFESKLENLSIIKSTPLNKRQQQALKLKEKLAEKARKQQEKTNLFQKRKEKKPETNLTSSKLIGSKSELLIQEKEIIQKKKK